MSLQTVAIIGVNEFEKSICCITFSKVDGGALLCAIDESMDHTISIWDWQKKERSAKLTENKVTYCVLKNIAIKIRAVEFAFENCHDPLKSNAFPCALEVI